MRRSTVVPFVTLAVALLGPMNADDKKESKTEQRVQVDNRTANTATATVSAPLPNNPDAIYRDTKVVQVPPGERRTVKGNYEGGTVVIDANPNTRNYSDKPYDGKKDYPNSDQKSERYTSIPVPTSRDVRVTVAPDGNATAKEIPSPPKETKQTQKDNKEQYNL